PHGRPHPAAIRHTPAGDFPVPRGVEAHAVLEAGAELGDGAIFERGRLIDRRPEGAGEDHDAALAGVHAVSQRPVDLLVRRDVDVLFDDVDVLVAILRRGGAPARRRDLLRLPLVALLDLAAVL